MLRWIVTILLVLGLATPTVLSAVGPRVDDEVASAECCGCCGPAERECADDATPPEPRCPCAPAAPARTTTTVPSLPAIVQVARRVSVPTAEVAPSRPDVWVRVLAPKAWTVLRALEVPSSRSRAQARATTGVRTT